jgi:hypothetical protein
MKLTASDARAAFGKVRKDAETLGLFPADSTTQTRLPKLGEREKRIRAGEPDPVSTVSLVLNDAGVLLWREAAPIEPVTDPSMREEPAPSAEGELIELYQYEKLEPNQINEFLTNLDARLNKQPGLWRLRLVAGSSAPEVRHASIVRPSGAARRLLFIHGTFSESRAFFAGIGRASNGAAFLRRIFTEYQEVLAFEHPTLSVSPVLNAFDLHGAMADARGPLDIIAHSRGGLLARWFLEGFGGAGAGDGPYRAVLVGSPLSGTSLASPPRLKDALSMLSNIGAALEMGGAAASVYMPLLAAPLALLKVATSVVSVAAKTPVIDAAISMIPGLASQSRVAMNHELARSDAFAPARPPAYFMVRSNFETEEAAWRFWRWFRKDRIADAATNWIFQGENDLVVDTRAMTELVTPSGGARPRRIPRAHVCDFGTSSRNIAAMVWRPAWIAAHVASDRRRGNGAEKHGRDRGPAPHVSASIGPASTFASFLNPPAHRQGPCRATGPSGERGTAPAHCAACTGRTHA